MLDSESIISKDFFSRPAEQVAPDLIGCIFQKRMPNKQILSGIIVETEAYSQEEPACHGFSKRYKRNETLFGEPGNLYVYLTYGMHHCVNIVTDRKGWASGVLLRSIEIPDKEERIASGPGLLARYFDLNISHDNLALSIENGVWVKKQLKSFINMSEILQTKRVGISKGKDLDWRWYLKTSRSISKRVKGDKIPTASRSWTPEQRPYK